MIEKSAWIERSPTVVIWLIRGVTVVKPICANAHESKITGLSLQEVVKQLAPVVIVNHFW